MSNKLFPKVTHIEGDGTSVTTPTIDMRHNSAVVFLIGASAEPLTITAKGFKDDGTEKDINFETKGLTGIDWTERESGDTIDTAGGAQLVAIPSPFLMHDGLDSVALTIDGDTDGVAIYAFEIATRYIPE